MEISKKVSYKLTEVNVIMTLLIVWLHISSYYDVPAAISHISVVAVPCFWAISSFLYFKSFDWQNPLTSYRSKVASRIRSLLIPFFVFSIFGLLFSMLAYRVHPVEHHPLEGVSFDTLFDYIYSSKANGPIWYLRSLFAFILVAPILGYVIRISKWTFLLVIPIFFLCRNVDYYYFPYWGVNIFTGAYFAIYYDYLFFNRMQNYRWINLGVIISMLLLVILFMVDDGYVLRAVAPICIMAITSTITVLPEKAVLAIAPYTMLIYCLHLPVSRITEKIPQLLHITSPIFSLILATILTVIAITVAGILLKKSPHIWKLATGGR